jgi:hypothetical protein
MLPDAGDVDPASATCAQGHCAEDVYSGREVDRGHVRAATHIIKIRYKEARHATQRGRAAGNKAFDSLDAAFQCLANADGECDGTISCTAVDNKPKNRSK